MRLVVLGSGSAGNCYLIQSKEETLILEAGLTYKEILKGLNFNVSNVVGVLCSHTHGDHFKAIPDMAKNFLPIYGNDEVINKVGVGTVLTHKKPCNIGQFKVIPLDVKHDVKCHAFIIIHPEMGKLLFCTDAASLPYFISGANHLLIEANYDERSVEDYAINNPDSFNNINRLQESHLSLDQAKSIIKRHDSDKLKTTTIIHLSERNSNRDNFISECQSTIGKPVSIAEKGLIIEL